MSIVVPRSLSSHAAANMKLSTVATGVLLAAASSVAAKEYIVTYPLTTDPGLVRAKAEELRKQGAKITHEFSKSPGLLDK